MESVTLVHEGFGNVGGVLNAFRHHGIGHARTSSRAVCVTIVLNAFRHHGIGHRSSTTTPAGRWCAQRLPASWNRSLFHSRQQFLCVKVLNAFRHHGIGHVVRIPKAPGYPWCSTPSGIMESVTRPYRAEVVRRNRVLNAFRHHGIGHGVRLYRRAEAGFVLNAFRHHGIGHAGSAAGYYAIP